MNTKNIPPAERSAIGYQDRSFFIPDNMAHAIDNYIERGEPVGDFLTALICNNLSEAIGRADYLNLANLPAFAAYFYNYAPASCWGSKEKMDAWLELFRAGSSDQSQAPAAPNPLSLLIAAAKRAVIESADMIGATYLSEDVSTALNEAIEAAGGWTQEESEKLDALALGSNVPEDDDGFRAEAEAKDIERRFEEDEENRSEQTETYHQTQIEGDERQDIDGRG